MVSSKYSTIILVKDDIEQRIMALDQAAWSTYAAVSVLEAIIFERAVLNGTLNDNVFKLSTGSQRSILE